MTVAQMLAAARTLSYRERVELIKQLVDSLDDGGIEQRKRSILEFEGVGAELWEGVDLQNYVSGLRDELDREP